MLFDSTMDGPAGRLRYWFEQHVGDADVLAFRTGFLTLLGLRAVLPGVEDVLEQGGSFHLVTGGAPEQADPAALRELLRLTERYGERCAVHVVEPHHGFQNAKTYYAERSGHGAVACVGSANLTDAGLDTNDEVLVHLRSDNPDEKDAVDAVLRNTLAYGLQNRATPLSPDLITRLERQRQRARWAPWSADQQAQPTDWMADLLQPAMDDIDAIAGRPSDTTSAETVGGVATGFADLDEVTSGLHPGSFVIIGSRPAVGKTTLMLNIAANAAIRRNAGTAVFSCNGRKSDIVQRILAAQARIRLTDMRGGRMTDEDWTRLARGMNEISDAPLHINCMPSPTIDTLCAHIATAVREHDLRLVTIDSINAVSARSSVHETREREVSDVARRLKTLALELDVAIVATAELGRTIEARTDKWPLISDFRDSDVIAQVADVVILINRPDAQERDDPRAGEADLLVAKNLTGPVASVLVAHQLHYARFADLAL